MATTTEHQRQSDQRSPGPSPARGPWITDGPGKLAQGAFFGLAFGFLLQKGGVAKFDVLVGVLLLEHFTVVKVMLSAIIVGMVGVYSLRRMGILEPQIKETALGANVAGGLVFGAGFGLLAYCPGTDAAAVGQGNFDAVVGILGMAFGSYLFALSSRYSDDTLGKWGRYGKITLADLARVSPGVFIAIAVPVLVGVLALLELYAR